MKFRLLFLVLFPLIIFGQNPKKEAKAFQKKINEQYSDEEHSPLKEEDRAEFKTLEFFKINKKYVVLAKVKYFENDSVFEMHTSTERKPLYRRVAELQFEIEGKAYILYLYQNVKSSQNPIYKNSYFLPFSDKTNGSESYGGGRYLDLKLEKGAQEVMLNFNLAYNPYCAYNEKYSCPKVPIENILEVAIPAGVKAPEYH